MRIGARVTSSSKRYGSYPSLKNEDIDGCIAYAAELTRERVVPLVHRENAPIYSQEIFEIVFVLPPIYFPYKAPLNLIYY